MSRVVGLLVVCVLASACSKSKPPPSDVDAGTEEDAGTTEPLCYTKPPSSERGGRGAVGNTNSPGRVTFEFALGTLCDGGVGPLPEQVQVTLTSPAGDALPATTTVPPDVTDAGTVVAQVDFTPQEPGSYEVSAVFAPSGQTAKTVFVAVVNRNDDPPAEVLEFPCMYPEPLSTGAWLCYDITPAQRGPHNAFFVRDGVQVQTFDPAASVAADGDKVWWATTSEVRVYRDTGSGPLVLLASQQYDFNTPSQWLVAANGRAAALAYRGGYNNAIVFITLNEDGSITFSERRGVTIAEPISVSMMVGPSHVYATSNYYNIPRGEHWSQKVCSWEVAAAASGANASCTFISTNPGTFLLRGSESGIWGMTETYTPSPRDLRLIFNFYAFKDQQWRLVATTSVPEATYSAQSLWLEPSLNVLVPGMLPKLDLNAPPRSRVLFPRVVGGRVVFDAFDTTGMTSYAANERYIWMSDGVRTRIWTR